MSVCGPILVFLASGTQGSAVVRAVERRGHTVKALVRTRPGDNSRPSSGFVLGDLDDMESLVVAAEGCAHAVLQIPTGPEAVMVRQTGNALDAFRRAGLRSVVLKLASASRPAPCAEPSFAANAAVEALVRGAGLPFVIVRPTMYLYNLLKPSARSDIIERGTFSPPLAVGQRIAWTSADDCASAAILLLEQERYGEDHRIAGPESVDGEELAARLTLGLGRPITYRSEPLDIFERDVEAALGSGMGRTIASKFRYFRDHPDDADRILAGSRDSVTLPGLKPTTIKAWARQRREAFR